MINFCVFEDSYYKQLMPLTETRPACSLLIGTNTIFDKINTIMITETLLFIAEII